MSLLESLSEFFENIFKRSSPEFQKKQLIRKLDVDLRNFEPAIYKNGMLLPNFAEAIYVLYKNTQSLDNLFSTTVSSSDVPRQHRFEAQLIITAYSPEFQKIIDSLDFDARKEAVIAEMNNSDRVYIHQRQLLEKTLKELNTENFRLMDKDILALRQLVDFCHIGFVPILQIFDTNFQAGDFSYKPNYTEIPVEKAVNLLEDLYYQVAGMKITTTLSEQVVALAQLRKGIYLSNEETSAYISNLKKINYVITRVLTTEHLKTLIRIAKQDVNIEPQVASYTGSPRQEFANLLQSRFNSDEQRIKSELQDERISSEVAELFNGTKLEDLFGYNSAENTVLQSNTPMSFMWILPMRILKTFLQCFMSESIKALLNDIVIEGFFSNPSYKTDFSSIVYSAISAGEQLQEFEDSFGQDKPNSIAIMQSYIKDSHKDKDFYRRLEKMVITTNNQAHDLLQSITSTLYSLFKNVGELLADSRKPSSEIIQNLKVLMFSSRNKDSTNLLEEQYPSWKIFFEIMKNYVIINTSEM